MTVRSTSRVGTRELTLVVLILLTGAWLRFSYLEEIAGQPGLDHPPVDEGFSLYWARSLATGDWALPVDAEGRDPRIRESAYIRAPGYAHFLAVLYQLTGGRQLWIRAAQMLLGLATGFLAWRLGRRVFSPLTGLLWCGLVVTAWPLIYFEGALNENAILVFATMISIWVANRWLRTGTAIAGASLGLCLGLLSLLRANALLAVPVVAVWHWLSRRDLGRRRVRSLVALVGTVGLVLIPSTWRNHRISGEIVLVSADAGLVLYRGNHEGAVGYSTNDLGRYGQLGSPWELPDVVERVAAIHGRPMTFSEASRTLGSEARAWMADHPRRVLELVLERALLLLGPEEIAHNRAVGAERRYSPVLRRSPVGFPLTLGGALVGLALLVTRSPTGRDAEWSSEATAMSWLMVALGTVWAVSFLPFLVTTLYRTPLLLVMSAGLAVSLSTLVGWYAAGHWKRAVGWGLVLVLVQVLVRVPWIPVDPGLDRWHFDRGLALLYEGRHSESKSSFEAAIAENDALWQAYLGVGKLEYDAGNPSAAEPAFRRAARLQPQSGQAHFNLGLSLARLGRWPEAERAFEDCLERTPTHADAWTNLGISREHLQRDVAARLAYERALELAPGDLRATNNLAWLLSTSPREEVRDGGRAVSLMESLPGVKSNPSLLDTLAAAYAEAGRFGHAVEAMDDALELLGPTTGGAAGRMLARRVGYERSQPHRDGE